MLIIGLHYFYSLQYFCTNSIRGFYGVTKPTHNMVINLTIKTKLRLSTFEPINCLFFSGNAYLPHFLSSGAQQPGPHFPSMNQRGFGGEYATEATIHRATWLTIGDRFKSPTSLTRRYAYKIQLRSLRQFSPIYISFLKKRSNEMLESRRPDFL